MSLQQDIQTVQIADNQKLKGNKVVLTSHYGFHVHTHLFINNEFVPGHGPLIDTVNPATEQVICSVHSADQLDVDAAVKAAQLCFDSVWSKTSPAERGYLMNRLADLMELNKHELATLDTLDNGKAFSASFHADVTESISCFRYYAGWADKMQGKTIDTTHDKLCYTRCEPVGIVGAMVSWNYPTLMLTWKLAPALAAGNCTANIFLVQQVVLKSSEVTPLSALRFAEIVKEAGFPPGVVNIITGYGHTTGKYLTDHSGVSKLAFTGSTATGRVIMETVAASSNLKRLHLELGGKNAQIVCADADLVKAAAYACIGAFNNHGQSCNAGSRIYVQQDVYEQFMKLFIAETKKIVLGDPFDKETIQGPQINQAQFNKVLNYIKMGQEEGATLLLGGKRWGNKGYYIEPTIFTHCNNSMRIMQDEIFGPVVAITTFDTIQEAIDMANDSCYGLTGGVYTANIDTAIKVSNEMQVGTVWVNCYDLFDNATPYGGCKQSGFGKELGMEALEEYMNIKVVKIQRSML
ncbi:hypothetical protein MBANPS3_004931 [Mucor bainieri]